ncbi:hypothetical protein N9N19_05440 [Porticoccaceae bacterium]|jgi:hypothetical protein|nr:hypothetical protein [Porticoccaceae bacterium]
MTNTYKMCWMRSIVEYLINNPCEDTIKFDELSPLIFKYYWNQIIFFDLQQGSNPDKPPEICQIVKKKIDLYKGKKPEVFTRVLTTIDVPVKEISNVLIKDVSWRFLEIDGNTLDLYELNKNTREIKIKHSDIVRNNADILFELINYRWVQELEKYNSSPRISKKVNGTNREDIKRGSLRKFHKYLDLENPNKICFISGKKIQNLSVDHVIPWSYLYSDDLWNLVYVEQGLNSSKSNTIPSEEMIEKLIDRNHRLMKKMLHNGFTDKQKEELDLSIRRDYVKQFWIGCKG